MSRPRPEGEPFRTQIRVRYEETDAAGVVYYANYLRYFEVARVELLRALGVPITEVEERGIALPAVEAHCAYVRPGRLDDLLAVDMWLEQAGRAAFSFTYEVRRGDELIATGRTRHAIVSRGDLRPLRAPGWLEELLGRAQGQQAGPE